MLGPNNSTRLRPVIRIFVSSTFSDLKLERDVLAQRVWPKLEQLCLEERFQFQAIDLRWGVPTEAGLHHRTMRICFEELRRSQEVSPEPNFLILLGNRYGWRPLPEEISAEEFCRLTDAAHHVNVVDQQRPIDVLRKWYLLDENSRTPVYILRPRRTPKDGEPASTDYTVLEAWRPVERTLWRIVNRAFPPEELRNRFQIALTDTGELPSIVRFQASATEQEIWAGALSAPNAARHVRAFFRGIVERDEFSRIEVKDFFDLTEANEFDGDSKTALEELKEAIRARLGGNAVFPIQFSRLKRHEGKALIDASEDEIQGFCDDVERALKEIIERQIREYWEPKDPVATESELIRERRKARELEIERDEHQRFARERGDIRHFVGREGPGGPLPRIRKYLARDARSLLLIEGESGFGKTALLARAFLEIPEETRPILRFLGITPASSDLRGLLTSLCQELRLRNPREGTLPNDLRELMREFHEHLLAASSDRPLILFLDALDQLVDADDARMGNWFPAGEWPPHAKVILTDLPRQAVDAAQRSPFDTGVHCRIASEHVVKLDLLTPAEATSLLDGWLHAAGRTFGDDQEAGPNEANQAAQRKCIAKALQENPIAGQPLYLKLFFEEIKLWKSFDPAQVPGRDVPELLAQLVERLRRKEHHGQLLVDRALGYLASARRGLTEAELLEVLYADDAYHHHLVVTSEENQHQLPAHSRRIPIVLWARLRSELAGYLSERAASGGNVLAFYHRQVKEWIEKNLLTSADWNPHEKLAEYFASQPSFLSSVDEQRAVLAQLPPTTRHANLRKVDELPFLRLLGIAPSGMLLERDESRPERALIDLLLDICFLEAKTEGGMVYLLADDLAAALAAISPRLARRRLLELILKALRTDLTFVATHPTTLAQCLWNRGWWHDCESAMHFYDWSDLEVSGGRHPAGRRKRLPWELHPTLSSMLESWARLDLTTGFRRPWLRAGRPSPMRLDGSLVAAVPPQGSPVAHLAIDGSGERFATAHADGSIRIMGTRDGRMLATLTSSTNHVPTTIAFHSSLDRLLATFPEGKLLQWNVATGELADDTELVTHTHAAILRASVDPVIACVSSAGQLMLHRKGGTREHGLGVNTEVTALAAMPGGKEIGVGFADGHVNVIEVGFAIGSKRLAREDAGLVGWLLGWLSPASHRTVPERPLTGLTQSVVALAASPDGALLAAADAKCRVVVWNWRAGTIVSSNNNGYSIPTGLAISADRRRLFTGSVDGRVRISDVTSGKIESEVKIHEAKITALVGVPQCGEAIIGTHNGAAGVWDLTNLAPQWPLKDDHGEITALEISPDGTLIASAAGATLHAFRLSTGEARHERSYESHVAPITAITIAPHNGLIVSGDREGQIFIWPVKNADIPLDTLCRNADTLSFDLQAYRSHDYPIKQIRISPEGDVVAATDDRTVSVWDLKQGRVLFLFKGSSAHPYDLEFQPARVLRITWWGRPGMTRITGPSGREQQWTLWSHETFFPYGQSSWEDWRPNEKGDDDPFALPACKLSSSSYSCWSEDNGFTRLVQQKDRVIVGWLPHALNHVVITPDQRHIVGAVGNHLYVYRWMIES